MSTYTPGQVLPNGYTVTGDTVATGPDGTTVETILSHIQTGVDAENNPIFSTQSEVITTPGAGTPAANQAVTLGQLQTDAAVIHTWLANNPNGAALTAAQTRVLARLLGNLTMFAIGSFTTAPVTS